MKFICQPELTVAGQNELKLDVNFVQRICGSPIVDTEPLFGDLVAQESILGIAESIPRNRFLGSIDVYKYGLRAEPVQLFDVDIYFTSPFLFFYVLDTLFTYV